MEKRYIYNIAAICLLSFMVISCSGTSKSGNTTLPTNGKGDRLLGIDVNTAEDNNYDKAFQIAKGAGMEIVTLSINWNDIESQPNIYVDKNSVLGIANAYYPAQNIKVNLVIQVIHTNRKEVPTDLESTQFDDPVMINRFKNLLDYVFSQVPDIQLYSLAIGNEIDGYLEANNTRWAQYQTFYQSVSTYARTKRSGLKVGTKAIFYGLTGSAKNFLLTLNNYSDVIMLTYYPLNSDYTVRNPSVVQSDFESILNLYPSTPIIMDVGYPSGILCNSSELKQKEFIQEIFKAWDKYADNIPMISFTWLTDLSPDAVNVWKSYYGVSDPAFAEYLETLGLRTFKNSGTDKQSFTALKEEAEKRGW